MLGSLLSSLKYQTVSIKIVSVKTVSIIRQFRQYYNNDSNGKNDDNNYNKNTNFLK